MTLDDDATTAAKRRPRLSSLVNLGLAAALIAVVGTLSLSSRQPPPPSIAEFAPTAVQQIKKARADSTSNVGQAGGAGGGLCRVGAPCPTPTHKPTPKATPKPGPSPKASLDPAAARPCIGEPARQTEDPQSPPCVPYFKGDNGGATYQGVTATEIRVAWATDPAETSYEHELRVLEQYFNQRYTFYGRRLRLIPYTSSGSDNLSKSGPKDMIADAVKVDQELKAFAAVNYGDRIGSESVYYDELAKRGVLSVESQPTFSDEAHRDAKAPYEWSYLPGPDLVSRNTAEWVCKTLAGRAATHAGPGSLGSPRKFGIIYHGTPDGLTPQLGPLKAGLAGCNASAQAVVQVTEPAPGNDVTTPYVNAVKQFKAKGVTSVICLCRQAVLLYSTQAASQNSYSPEWLISTWKETDDEPATRTMPSDQASHIFGLSFWNKRIAPEDMPCQQAAREVDPTFTYQTHHTLVTPYFTCERVYKPLLLLASGIQLAGPKLTPASFQRGMYEAEFPNPDAARAPGFQAAVDFGPGRHVENSDAAVIWWSATERSFDSGGTQGVSSTGTFCYVDRGRRYGVGQWPAGAQALFQGACR